MTERTPPQPSSSRAPFDSSTRGAGAPKGEHVAVPAARWDAIVADLGARGVGGTPELVSAQAVTWTSGALGCPSPGAVYTQALVDGMQVVVIVDGATYDYRFGWTDSPKLCRP